MEIHPNIHVPQKDLEIIDWFQHMFSVDGIPYYRLPDMNHPQNRLLGVDFKINETLHLQYNPTPNQMQLGFTLAQLKDKSTKSKIGKEYWNIIMTYRHGRADDKIWIANIDLWLKHNELCTQLLNVAQRMELEFDGH